MVSISGNQIFWADCISGVLWVKLSAVSMFLCIQDIHKNLERKIAAFHGREDAILYSSCFDANAGLFEALLSKDDAIISDELNHASIIDGIRLAKAARLRYTHRDMNGNLFVLFMLRQSVNCYFHRSCNLRFKFN